MARTVAANRLNDLTAKEWISETVSVWMQRTPRYINYSFCTRGKSASRRALCPCFHPRPEDAALAVGLNAGLCKEEELGRRRRGSRRGFRGHDSPPEGDADEVDPEDYH